MRQLSLLDGAPIVECVRVGHKVRVRLVSGGPPLPRSMPEPQYVRFPQRLRTAGARYACAAVRVVAAVLEGEGDALLPYYVARGPYRLLPPPAPTEERAAGKARDAELLAPGEAAPADVAGELARLRAELAAP